MSCIARRPFKVIGAGMSFSGTQLTNGTMVSLDHMDKILSINVNDHGALVEVEAGIRLRNLCIELEGRNLTLLNLGATATQSLGGASQTSTHGTGYKIGSVATQIKGMTIVNGRGDVLRLSEHSHKDIYQAARVSIGALGVITSFQIQAVPLFKLKRTTLNYDLEVLLSTLPDLMERYDRMQWSFLAYTNTASVVVREEVPIDTPRSPELGCWDFAAPANCTDVAVSETVQ
jgi:FAD/FMN-containing dehydrogenase